MFCLLVFPGLLSAQEISEDTNNRMEILLDVGHEFKLDQSSVRFLKVISDSRCPKKVTCIWEGEAKILLGITENGEYYEKEYVIGGNRLEFMLSDVLQLQVSQLSPYPETGAGIAPEEYKLRFTAILSEED